MSHPKGKAGGSQPPAFTAHEMECKICYERFDGRTRQPKLLACSHRVCARCLSQMADVGESPGCISCPFCRQETPVPEKDVARLPEDGQVLAALGSRERARKPGAPSRSPEVLLCPSILEPFADGKHSSSDCLVITLLEMPEDLAAPDGVGVLDVMRLYRPPSLASLPCHASLAKCQSCRGAWRAIPRFLVGVLCLVYFSSLPLGIYLLLVERLHLGIALVSLVPSTLVACVFYSLCQCMCHRLFDLPS
ncbi:E3 ubiquitin-protein ligase RNF182-like [Elgaria multicarinata webbii]|uniref:E3 ubiquitin-protein ligase RNF182-like n=1 Tax=Elgaria multicarinata webbii TaxID=159646 RepID=UPI002FCD1E0D